MLGVSASSSNHVPGRPAGVDDMSVFVHHWNSSRIDISSQSTDAVPGQVESESRIRFGSGPFINDYLHHTTLPTDETVLSTIKNVCEPGQKGVPWVEMMRSLIACRRCRRIFFLTLFSTHSCIPSCIAGRHSMSSNFTQSATAPQTDSSCELDSVDFPV